MKRATKVIRTRMRITIEMDVPAGTIRKDFNSAVLNLLGIDRTLKNLQSIPGRVCYIETEEIDKFRSPVFVA